MISQNDSDSTENYLLEEIKIFLFLSESEVVSKVKAGVV
jgi:hypothetical protein